MRIRFRPRRDFSVRNAHMNFSKSKVLLKKINAIHDSGASFDHQLSALERDLLLQYLRQLYECVLGEEEELRPVGKVKSPSPKVERFVEPPTSHRSETMPRPEVDIHPVEKKQPKAEVQPPEKEKFDPELEALFLHSEMTDLSQRFANTPISDVSKAMGINDKILTINELFKGNQQHFDEVVNRLNSFSTFDDAKSYLINGVASKNEWSNKKNKQKAERFVKLVRRRYL